MNRRQPRALAYSKALPQLQFAIHSQMMRRDQINSPYPHNDVERIYFVDRLLVQSYNREHLSIRLLLGPSFRQFHPLALNTP